MITQAFILAAGYGTRMRPITNNIPKPMVEINGHSLITRLLDQLIEYRIKSVVINCFYKKELLKQHISEYIKSKKNPPKIHMLEEEPLLETGGGIINALPFLEKEPFFVINSDSVFVGQNIFSYLNLSWKPSMKALFLLADPKKSSGYLGKGDFDINSKNQLTAANKLNYPFPGIHITTPENFYNLKTEPTKLMQIYDLYKKDQVYNGFYGKIYNGHWFHVDTPESLKNTENELRKLQ